MPFVTEAIWGALPHRADDPELLIVAGWPGPTAPIRRRAAIGAVIESSGRSATPALERGSVPADLAARRTLVPRRRSAPTFGALAPAIARLARARPLVGQPTREALGRPTGRRLSYRRRRRHRGAPSGRRTTGADAGAAWIVPVSRRS